MNSKYRLIDINLKQASHFIILSEDHISKITGTNAIKRRNYVDDIKCIAKLSLNTKWMASLTIFRFYLKFYRKSQLVLHYRMFYTNHTFL